jgi:hypothetical protein
MGRGGGDEGWGWGEVAKYFRAENFFVNDDRGLSAVGSWVRPLAV